MIRETVLDTTTDTTDGTAPGLLRVTLSDDAARLTWTPTDSPHYPPPTFCFAVPARSLLLALRAAWDDTHPGRSDLDPAPAPRRPRPQPPNGRQPWTSELDEVLRETWMAAAESTPAGEVIGELMAGMGRSRGSIRARLARIGCDPDVPGRVLREE